MAELNEYLEWETAMCICEETVTNAVQNKTFGIISQRFNMNNQISYSVHFFHLPKKNGNHSDKDILKIIPKRVIKKSHSDDETSLEKTGKKQKIGSSVVKKNKHNDDDKTPRTSRTASKRKSNIEASTAKITKKE